MKRISPYIFCLTIYFMVSCNSSPDTSDPLALKAMTELKQVLSEQQQFIKVHAAEYLIWLGQTEEVKKVYLVEDSLHSSESPYRIGIWRVLAQSERSEADRLRWIAKIMDAYGNPNSPDRLHATETLAKLKQSPLKKYPALTQQTLQSENRNLVTYALWAVSYADDSALEQNRPVFLRLALEDSMPVIRKISAYILRRIGGLNEEAWLQLVRQAAAEPDTSGMKRSLLNTAFVTAPPAHPQLDTLRKEMTAKSGSFSSGERIELALSLADRGATVDLPVLEAMLNNQDADGIYEVNSKEGADVRATAAYAILKIKQRTGAGNHTETGQKN